MSESNSNNEDNSANETGSGTATTIQSKPAAKKPAAAPPKKNLNSQAAKILEQYRNAGKIPQGTNADGSPIVGENGPATPAKPSAPPTMPMRRSGTRGK